MVSCQMSRKKSVGQSTALNGNDIRTSDSPTGSV